MPWRARLTAALRLCAKPGEEPQRRWWFAWFQTSAEKYLRTALFCVVTKRVVVISYRRFGATCRCGITCVSAVGVCRLYRFEMSSLSIVVVYIDLSTFAALLSIDSSGISSVWIALAYCAYRLLCLHRFVCLCCLLINKLKWCELKSGWTIRKCCSVTGRFTITAFDLLQPVIRTWRRRELWGGGPELGPRILGTWSDVRPSRTVQLCLDSVCSRK